MIDAEKLLKPVLEKIAKDEGYNDNKAELTPIHSGGANYTSQLYEVTISAPEKNLKLFSKVAILGEKFRSQMTLQIFETEILFYTKIMSKYRKFEKLYEFADDERLVVPKYYGGSVEYMKETLVLEELTAKGYQPFDRFKCYDWEYASKCVSIIARLHALSIRYEKDDPEEYTDMINMLKINWSIEDMKNFIANGVATCMEVVADEYKEKLAKFVEDIMDDETFMTYYSPARIVTLNHGDFRPSNILHKTNEDGNLDLVLIDYQLLQKGNPVMDLLYFLICGSDEDFRGKHLNQFFEHYYEVFRKTLQKLQINPDEVYTKTDFDADIKKYFPFGIILGVLTLPVITVEADNAPKIEGGMELDNFTIAPSDLFRIRFNGLLKDYIKMGIL